MIVLDTNVLSEPLKREPSSAVLDWLKLQPPSGIFTTAITQGELLYGIQRMPEGKRKAAFLVSVQQMLRDDFGDRILAFDSYAAVSYGWIRASRDDIGRPISVEDAQIAAIVHSRGATLATRNARDFEYCGIKVLNPWA